MERLQRFSIRKLSIGAVSCVIGTVAFFSYSNEVKAAENTDTSLKIVETNSANNPATSNVTVNNTNKQAVANTSDQSKSEDPSAVAPTSEKTQLQTSQDSSIKVKENNLNNDKSDTTKAVAKPTNLNDENNSRDPDSKDIEVKPKESSNVDTNEQKEKDVTLATNSPASETNASPKPVQTVSPEQPANATDAQPASDQSESAAANSNALENNGRAASAPTALPKQPANADTQPTATTSGVQPFMNLAVASYNNELAPKRETVDSTWTLHYVNQADHKQELKDPTVMTMQYTRTNTPQSDGTTQYGDWSYVPGSFKQTGTPITVKDSDNPVKQDNVDKNGENFDVFTITAMYPTVAGYGFYNGINGTRLHDNLRNNERQADAMSKDFYAEYDVAKPMSDTITSKWTIHYVKYGDHQQELKAPTVITRQYTRTNTLQSNGKIRYGDWSYVPGSFKLTGTPIAVNGSDNPTKEDNVDKDGKNYDVFSIVVQHPDITGYELHNATNGVRISDLLQNDDSDGDILVMSPTMNNDRYVEYDVAKERSIAVKFVDDQYFKQQVGQAITLTGHDGDTVNLKLTVPDKYKLADGQQLPTTYTFTKGSGDLTIHLVHKVVQREAAIDVQLGMVTSVHTSDNAYAVGTVTQARWKQLGDEIKDSVPSPNGLVEALPSVEVGTLTGHADYDLVDERVTSLGDDWTTLNLGGKTYQLPNGDEVVNGIMIDGDTTWGKSFKEDNLKSAQIEHVDLDPDYVNRPWHGYLSVNATNNDDNGFIDVVRSMGLQAGLVGDEPNALAKAIGDRAATSVEMSNKNIDLNLLQGYDFDFSEQDGQLRANAVLLVSGVYVPYVEKTATRTINVTTPDGKITTVKQTATLVKQIASDKDAHPAWTTSEWANYDVPTIPGYTASQSQIAKTAVTGTTEDQTVNITYTANPQTATVVYQSEDGISVHTTTVNGHTGQTVKVSNEVPVGWHVVNGTVPSEITFGPNGTPKTVVTIAHSHATVTPDAPKTTSDKLPDNPGKTYPAGVSHDDLNKTITGTIKVTMPDGQIKTVVKATHLTRTADVDEVTGEVKYSDWTTGYWSAYTAPSVPGYTANYPYIAGQSVNGETEDQTIEITYTANEHQISVEYVDNATGKILKTDHMSGKTGQTVSITPHIPNGWELVSGQSVPSEVTLGADGTPATVIKVQPQERSVAVKFVDDQSDERQVGQAITLTGRDGGTVDLNLTVPDKYRLADGQQLPTTYTFAKGSGDLTIHLAHQVVQREATVDVQLQLVTIVHSDVDDDYDGVFSFVVPQNQWKQLDDEIKDSKNPNSDKVFPLVKVGTLTGHVNYDLVDNNVMSFKDDWTSLNLGGQTYQMPDGTEVVNGVLTGSVYSWGKSLKEQLLKYHPNTDSDYVNRAWHGYLSANKTNEIVASDFISDYLQVGLAGNEPNALAKAIGDQAVTAVTMANKTIDPNWLKGKSNEFEFSERDGQLRGDAFVPVVGVYIPYVEKTATRTINITTPDGKTTTVKQTATLAKQIDFGEDVHPEWTTSEWSSYDVPTIQGYTVSQSSVAKETVTGTTEDQTVNITYTANDGTQTIVYQDEDGSEIDKQVISGKTDEKVKVTSDVPDGYVLKGEVPSEVTIKPDDTPITVTVEHGKSHVTPDKPVNKGDLIPDTKDKHYPEGLTHNDLNKTVTREITIIDPTGKKSTTAQTVTFTRGATVDEVTGEVTYDLWSENGTHTFDKVDVPTVPGYTPSGEVPSIVVIPDTKSSTVNIIYTANNQNITVRFIDKDDDDKLVGDPIVITGKTGETINLPKLPENYRLADGENNKITVTGEPSQSVTIRLKHQTEEKTVNKDLTYPIYGQILLPEWTGDLNKGFISSSKNASPETFMIASKKFNISFLQKVDKVTGKVIEERALNATDLDLGKINIPLDIGSWEVFDTAYDAGQSRFPYDYYFGTDRDLQDHASIKPPVDQNITVKELLAKYGYDSVYATVEDFPGITGILHGIIDPDSPQLKQIPAITGFDNPILNNPILGKHTKDKWDEPAIIVLYIPYKHEKKTVIRQITIVNPNGSKDSVLQNTQITRVTFDKGLEDRMGTINADWSTSSLPEYIVPQIPGYKASLDKVDLLPVDKDSQDTKVVITYTALDGTQTIIYRDTEDHDITKQQIPGKTDQKVKVTPEVPDGYVVKDKVPSEVTIKATDDPIIVTVQHGTTHVDHDHPVDKGDLIPGTEDKHYPAGLTYDDLNKTVTRTVNITDPSGKKTTSVQTVTFTRGATVDEVTGEVTYDDWSENGTHTFDKIDVPTVQGYTASGDVPSVVVTPESESSTVKITYTANDGNQTIVYQDDNDGEVGKQVVPGKTDQTVKVTPEIPDGYVVTGEVPSEVTIKPKDTPIIVHVEHGKSHVTPDKPVNKGDLIPGTKDKHYPDGLAHDDLNKTITRKVTIIDPTGRKTITMQTVTFTRDATIDEVTGEVTYGNWSENGQHTFDKVEVPTISGYTENSDVPSIVVTPSSTSGLDKVITYVANEGGQTIIYVDENGKKVGQQVVTGKTGDKVKVTPEIPSGYESNDKLPKEVTIKAKDEPLIVKVIEKIPEVNPDKNVTDDDSNKNINQESTPEQPSEDTSKDTESHEVKTDNKKNHTISVQEKHSDHKKLGEKLTVTTKSESKLRTATSKHLEKMSNSTLPQTGESKDFLSIMGLVAAALSGVFGFGLKKKKKE